MARLRPKPPGTTLKILKDEDVPQVPGDEDLLIYTPDKKLYWMSSAEYRNHELEMIEDDLYDTMVKAGVVLAELPPVKLIPKQLGEFFCACYLVNLASIRPPPRNTGATKRSELQQQPAPATQKTPAKKGTRRQSRHRK